MSNIAVNGSDATYIRYYPRLPSSSSSSSPSRINVSHPTDVSVTRRFIISKPLTSACLVVLPRNPTRTHPPSVFMLPTTRRPVGKCVPMHWNVDPTRLLSHRQATDTTTPKPSIRRVHRRPSTPSMRSWRASWAITRDEKLWDS